MKRLALKYRPKTFEQVVGQEYPKRIISQLIRNGQSCANLLLHGSVGSGKTTLVRIYAAALNCEAPTATGDRCFACRQCKAWDAGDDTGFTELDTPKFRERRALEIEIDRLLESAKCGKRTVIFLDEAHVLSKYRDSFDFLLKSVEETPPGVSFCFATTAVERISDALRSRTIMLELRPLTHEQSVGLLARTASEESLTFHPEALSLLAGLGEHQPRNMLQALDKMGLTSDGTKITRDRVADVFGVDYIEHLIQYFEALGAGDFNLQTRRFLRWSDSVRNKARLIQLFLVGLYYVELCGLDVSVEPVIASIREEERSRVTNAFMKRLPTIDLKAFFESLLNAWPVVTSDLSDEALLAVLMRFQASVNRGEIVPRSNEAERITAQPVGQEVPITASGRILRKRDDEDAPKDPAYLHRSHVRSIFAAASFLVQQGHPPFNARIIIRHRLFGHEEQAEASKHFAKFSQALKGQLENWGGSGLRVFVQERDEDEGSCGRVIAHVPDAKVADRWLKKWHRGDRVPGKEDEAITLEMVPEGEMLDGHWSCVRWLCGGFNPTDPIFAKLNIESAYRRVAGNIGKRTRLDFSEPLGAAARRKAELECGVDLVSAFDDKQWGRLYDGWELEEFRCRKEQKLLWQAALADVVARYPLDGSARSKEVQDYELEELRKRWAASAPVRPWAIWSRP
ncbi:AAA family ATPase [Bradyrhizobium diazoefficiens]|uniref:AAA family ATPase n=1 Tax=Bradyrhizobium diazoefficiens TaxID=1355477 RepID=UPI00190A3712|nr:AAA family ATPase [Bradyrhizobium diazoefficiens]QQO14792.1 AAA family ATPase [Bradyrhizobium diazoefficiens]